MDWLLPFPCFFDFVLLDFLHSGDLVEFLILMCIYLLVFDSVATEHAHFKYFFSRNNFIKYFQTFPAAFESEQVLLIIGCENSKADPIIDFGAFL